MQENESLDENELSQPPQKKKTAKGTDIHKGSWLSSVIKNGKWYLMGSLATKVLMFLMLPIYLRYLDPTEYGIFNSLNVIAQILPILLSFGLDAAFGRFFHDYKKDPEKLKTLFSTIFWFVAIYGFFLVILVIFSSQWWLKEAAAVPAYPYGILTFLPHLFMQLGLLGLIFLRQSLESKLTSLIETLGAVINVLVSIPLLIFWDMGVIARLWGNVGAALVIFLIMLYYFIRKDILKWRFDRRMLRIALIYSIPLIPAMASKWINMLSDRLILYQYIDMEAVGLYSLAANIAMLLFVIQNSASQVLQPVSISGLVHDRERTKSKMADFSLLMWLIMILANLGAFLFAKDVVTILANKSYEGSYIFIPILGFTFVLGAQYRFFSYMLQFHKKTKIISIATIASALANLTMNLIFIPIYGAIAAPFATVAAAIVLLLWIGIAAQRIDPIKLHWRQLILIGLVYVIATGIGLYFLFSIEVSIFNFLAKGAFFILVSAICIWIGNYQQPILDFIQKNLRK